MVRGTQPKSNVSVVLLLDGRVTVTLMQKRAITLFFFFFFSRYGTSMLRYRRGKKKRNKKKNAVPVFYLVSHRQKKKKRSRHGFDVLVRLHLQKKRKIFDLLSGIIITCCVFARNTDP